MEDAGLVVRDIGWRSCKRLRLHSTCRSMDKLESLANEAARNGAKLVLFPEAFLGGYPRGSAFGTVVGSRTPEGREWYRRYWESAVDVPGPEVDRLVSISRETGSHLVVGVIEREGGTLYCTVLFFSPTDGYLGKHRKLMPTAAERLLWGQGDGSTLPVFETPFGRVGAVICWENYMPLLRMAMYQKRVQIYCAPTADHRDTWLTSMQHIALEGRCFVLSANQFCLRSDYPADFPIDGDLSPDTIMARGGSSIIGPLGQILAGPNYDGETTLYAEIDLAEIPRSTFDFDVVGHYARPDVFRLEVNERPQRSVRFTES